LSDYRRKWLSPGIVVYYAARKDQRCTARVRVVCSESGISNEEYAHGDAKREHRKGKRWVEMWKARCLDTTDVLEFADERLPPAESDGCHARQRSQSLPFLAFGRWSGGFSKTVPMRRGFSTYVQVESRQLDFCHMTLDGSKSPLRLTETTVDFFVAVQLGGTTGSDQLCGVGQAIGPLYDSIHVD